MPLPKTKGQLSPPGAKVTDAGEVQVDGLDTFRVIDVLIEGQYGPCNLKIADEARDNTTRKMSLRETALCHPGDFPLGAMFLGTERTKGNAMSKAESPILIAKLQRSRRRGRLFALGVLASLMALLLIVAVTMFFARRRAEKITALETLDHTEQVRQEANHAEQRATGMAENREQKHPMEARPKDSGGLPNIVAFKTQPSDRFLVDLDDVSSGHPFKGVNSAQPHAGAHINFDNSDKRWPRDGNEPANYPAIYAVADGVISRVDFRFGQRGGNDRYGLDLAFAVDARGKECRLCYSIEPMIPEPSDGFYGQFLLVHKGQRVREGDVMAYMYCPPGVKDVHIHFHLMMDGKKGFLAPAIFSPDVVRKFHAKWGGFGRDGDTPMPPCIGYRIGAEENPFGTGAAERL